MTTKKIMTDVLIHGGITVWFGDFEPTTGYVVGDGNHGITFPNTDNFTTWNTKCINISIKAGSNLRNRKYQGWGAWIDDGIVYLDPVNHYSTFGEAVRAARERGEKAIYCLRTKEVIHTPLPLYERIKDYVEAYDKGDDLSLDTPLEFLRTLI